MQTPFKVGAKHFFLTKSQLIDTALLLLSTEYISEKNISVALNVFYYNFFRGL